MSVFPKTYALEACGPVSRQRLWNFKRIGQWKVIRSFGTLSMEGLMLAFYSRGAAERIDR